MINHPTRNPQSRTIAAVRAVVGRRSKISRQEMAAILDRLAAGGLELNNGWAPRIQGELPRSVGSLMRTDADLPATHAEAWAGACRGITCISVFDADDASVAQNASSNGGSIRYDQPGSMHPQLYAPAMFAPEELWEQSGDYLRRHAKRVLFVQEEAAEP